jgi:hypothetical protein
VTGEPEPEEAESAEVAEPVSEPEPVYLAAESKPEPPKEPVSSGEAPSEPRKGWWQRRSLFGD